MTSTLNELRVAARLLELEYGVTSLEERNGDPLYGLVQSLIQALLDERIAPSEQGAYLRDIISFRLIDSNLFDHGAEVGDAA